MTQDIQTDVVIIGAGPVGLFAVFQCGMLNMRCHVIDALTQPGGQCIELYPEKPIYDIPAFASVNGADLVGHLMEQAAPFAPTFHLGQQAMMLEETPDQQFVITTSKGEKIRCKAVIIAAGAGAFGPNRPPLEGIEQFEETSVFYKVVKKDAFAGKRIVIAGGGDSAVDWAILLNDIAAHVSVVHRRDKFRAAPDSVSKLRALAQGPALDLEVPYQLAGVTGENGQLTAVTIATLKGEQKTLQADILLPFFGMKSDIGPLENWGLTLERGQIVVDQSTCATTREGIYAVGDIATYPHKLKLILCGFSEAALAAHALYSRVHDGKALHFEHSTTRGVPQVA